MLAVPRLPWQTWLTSHCSNAIKFTKTAEKREIHVRYGALASTPSSDSEDLTWFPSGRERRNSDSNLDSKISKQFFLGFEIEDTGEGISKTEMSQLFKRFSQASPMTHVKVRLRHLHSYLENNIADSPTVWWLRLRLVHIKRAYRASRRYGWSEVCTQAG